MTLNSVASPSNFNPDRSMILLSSKSQVVSCMNSMPLPDVTLPVRSSDGGILPSVLIIDAMCVINMATKTPDMKNAKHFAEKFLNIIVGHSISHDEIRVVIDHYLPGSLKEKSR